MGQRQWTRAELDVRKARGAQSHPKAAGPQRYREQPEQRVNERHSMPIDLTRFAINDHDWDSPIVADRVAALTADLPPLAGAASGTGFRLELQANEMIEESLHTLKHQLGLVDRQVPSYTDRHGRLVCWTVQRDDVWRIADTSGQHIPTWSTVREDRRPLYSMMSTAMILRGLTPMRDPRPPVWAYLANEHGKPPPSNLRALVCDSTCGNGLPACHGHHVYPGHVALLLHIKPTDAVASNYSRWDLALAGWYVPADILDAAHFSHLLAAHHPGPELPTARNWAPVLRRLARASAVRAFDLTPGIPGMDRSQEAIDTDKRDRTMQVALPALKSSAIQQIVRGPSWDQADAWWSYAVKHKPTARLYRRHARLPVDQLDKPGTDGDSA